MRMKCPCRLSLTVFALTVVSVPTLGSYAAPRGLMVLPYSAFGPQVMAYELIGYEWYQWNSQGPDDPATRDTVKVVVYRGVSLDHAKRRFPVVRGVADYRYVEYGRALRYLEAAHKQAVAYDLPDLAAQVQKTRSDVLTRLGA